MIRVIIADDQAVIRDGIRYIAEQCSEIKVVGCAGNGKEAAELCDQLQPDVVLMDIVMPVCDGVEGTRLIKEKSNKTKVLILTTFNDGANISAALKNGADGYVLKDVDSDELILTIKSISKGLRVMDEEVYDQVLKKLEAAPDGNNPGKSPDLGLTGRENEIVKMVAHGKSNKEIASSLYMTEGSIRNIISGILLKTGMKSRTQLAVLAVQHDIV